MYETSHPAVLNGDGIAGMSCRHAQVRVVATALVYVVQAPNKEQNRFTA